MKAAAVALLALLPAGIAGMTAAGSVDRGDPYLAAPAGGQSCASCHGMGGEGGGEGGILIPALTTMRSPASLCRAVRDGRGQDGRILSRAMPRAPIPDRDCAGIWRYLTDAEAVPGIKPDRFAVRLDLPSGAAARWRDRFVAAFDPVNRAGGLYGRRMDVTDHGDAAIRIAVRDGQDGADAGVTIDLVGGAGDPRRRGIETDSDTERELILGEIARSGAVAVVWLGGMAEDVGAAAHRHGIAIVGRDRCGDARSVLVIETADGAVEPACAGLARVYILLRTSPAGRIGAILAARPRAMPVTVVTPMPIGHDRAADLIARIAIDTGRNLGGRPSRRRLLVAFDAAWRASAETGGTLFGGIEVRPVTLPALMPAGPVRWIAD